MRLEGAPIAGSRVLWAFLLYTFLWVWSAAGEPNTTDECFSFVNYVANTGDPATESNSTRFRGEVSTVENNAEQLGSDERMKLVWTFSGGESIRSSDVKVAPDEFDFSARSAGDTQEVTLTFNRPNDTDDEDADGVNFVFVGTKGTVDGSNPQQYKVGVPTDVRFNDHLCKPFDVEGVAVKQGKKKGEPLVVVEYLPLEVSNQRFTDGFLPTFTAFAIRGFNVGPENIQLEGLTMEYWFDGGITPGSGRAANDPPFRIECLQPETLCNVTLFEIKEGLPGVQGAKYLLHMPFRNISGTLLANPERLVPEDPSAFKGGSPLLEAIVAISSQKTLGQMNVTKDYSFKDTEIIEDPPLLGSFVNRRYEENPRLTAHLNGELVWGSPPAAGTRKVVQELNGHQCELTAANQTRCGLRMTYCCGPEVIVPEPLSSSLGDLSAGGTTNVSRGAPENEGSSQMDQLVVPLGAGLVAVLVGVGGCICCQCHRRHRRRRRESKAQALTLPTEDPKIKDDTEFMSMAWSDTNQDSIKFGVDEVATKKREIETEPLLVKETKFHTVPSISGADSCLLLDMKEKAECSDWNVRECKTWTGYVHWMWEEWNANFAQEPQVRRAASVMQSGGQPGGILTVNFQNLSCVPLNVDYKKEIDPYIGQKLGEGGFGKVYQSTWRHQKVAVKVLKVDSESMHQTLEDEIKLTSRFHHENIVKVLGACFGDKDTIALIMELVEGGNLSQLIHNKSRRKMEYMEVLRLGHDIAKALAYLHPTVIHRDLKPQNVLMDKHGHAKIADFGISKFKDPHKSYLSVTQTGGTPNYMAPELFNGTRVDERCDIFSLGCILYEAATRKVPFSDLPHDNFAPPLFQIIKTVAIDKKRPKIPEYCPHKLASLIRRCWNDNPKARPSAIQVKQILEELMKEELQRLKAEVIVERQESGKSASTATTKGVKKGTGSKSRVLDPSPGAPPEASELSHLNKNQSKPSPDSAFYSSRSRTPESLPTPLEPSKLVEHTPADQQDSPPGREGAAATEDRDTAHRITGRLGVTGPRQYSASTTMGADPSPEGRQRNGAKAEEPCDIPGQSPCTDVSSSAPALERPKNPPATGGRLGWSPASSMYSSSIWRKSQRRGQPKYAQWMRPVVAPGCRDVG